MDEGTEAQRGQEMYKRSEPEFTALTLEEQFVLNVPTSPFFVFKSLLFFPQERGH